MSVLSRPVLRRATAPTQRVESIPLPRTAPTSEGAAPAEAPPVPLSTAPTAPERQAPARTTRRRGPVLVAAGAIVALAVGIGAFAAYDDSSGPATVIAPGVVNAPSETDLARDRAAALRGSKAATVGSDAQQLTEARRDAAMLQRERNVQP